MIIIINQLHRHSGFSRDTNIRSELLSILYDNLMGDNRLLDPAWPYYMKAPTSQIVVALRFSHKRANVI